MPHHADDWLTVYVKQDILAIEAEAAAAERERHGGHAIPGFEAAYEAGRLDERERLRGEVDGVIFDLPIGVDVTYSRGYSAGIAAARQSVLALLAAETEASET